MQGVAGRLVAMVLYKGPRLLDLAKTPEHLQFNKYVLTGYRPVSTVQECLRSLFYMHNELGNIYTHGESGLAACVRDLQGRPPLQFLSFRSLYLKRAHLYI